MNLVRAETRRLFKRRVTRYMLVLMVLGFVAIAGAISIASQQIGAEQRAAAAAEAAREEESVRRQIELEREACERGDDPGRFPPGFECSQITPPPPGSFSAEQYLPYEFHFREQFSAFIGVFAGILALFAFVVGASYVGAEWSSGGMMNLLLWRPKRLTVLLTKLGVLLGGVLAIGLVLGALWTVAFWAIGRFDGRLGRLTAGAWQSFAIDGARGVGLVLATAAVAFGLASVGRHTAMALGAAVAVAVVSEIGVRIATSVAGVQFGERFVLSTYAIAWFAKRYVLFDWSAPCQNTFCEPPEYVVTWQQSAVVFGVGVAVLLFAALWTMRRRDIT